MKRKWLVISERHADAGAGRGCNSYATIGPMAQPHRGERELLGARVPPALAEAVREQAHVQGFRSTSDYLAAILAERHGFELEFRMAHDPAQAALVDMESGGARKAS